MRPFAGFCAAILAGFLWMEWRGVDLVPGARHVPASAALGTAPGRGPSSVRGGPGAFRTYRHWGGGGFRGGK